MIQGPFCFGKKYKKIIAKKEWTARDLRIRPYTILVR